MKALFFTTLYAPDIGANARIMTDLAQDFRAAGHDVTVVTTHPHYTVGTATAPEGKQETRVEEIDGVKVVRVPTYLPRKRTLLNRAASFVSYMLAAPRAVRRLHLAGDAIVAICPPLTTGFSAWLAGRRGRTPYAFLIQDLYPETAIELGYLRNPGLVAASRVFADFVHRRASLLGVISEGFRTSLMARGVRVERIRVFPNWVDETRFRPRPEDQASRKAELGVEGSFVVLFAGTMGLAQGLDRVLPGTLAKLAGERSIVFVLLGGGLRRPALEEECRARGLEQMRFVGPQSHDQMPSWLAVADAFLVHLRDIPLYRATIPSKSYEYMAMGKPLLMAVRGEAASLVETSGCGITVPPEDSAALAGAVLRLAREPVLCAEMGERGRTYAVRHYSRRAITGAFIGEVERMASASQGDPSA
jgi:colanic acid biosynthesis glycosyl transferase WcaI